MKTLLIVMLLFVTSFSYAQEHKICQYTNFSIYQNDTINKHFLEEKQGKWIHFEYRIDIKSHQCFIQHQSEYTKSETCPNERNIQYKLSEGKYLNNQPIGEWKYFYKTGELRKIAYYNEVGQKHLRIDEYYKNGNKKSILTENNGNWHRLKVYYPDGNPHFGGLFENGHLEKFVIFYQNDTNTIKYQGQLNENLEITELKTYNLYGKIVENRPLHFGGIMGLEDLIDYIQP